MKHFVLNAVQTIFPCRQRPLPSQIHSVLIIRQHDQLGDFLLSTPVFRELKKHNPTGRISVVVRPYVRSAAEGNPHIDEIIVYEPKVSRWTLSKLKLFLRQIRKRYDLAIVLSTPSRSFTSDLIAFISGARFRLGMTPRPQGDPFQYDFLYHATAFRPFPGIHQALENLTVLAPLGIESTQGRQEIFLHEDEILWARERCAQLGLHQAPILLLPGAGKKPNRWPADLFVELGKSLAPNWPLLVVWGPGQQDIGQTVLSGLRSLGAHTVEGTSIRQLAALAGQSALCICNDTGDLHVVASAGARTLALFGPTNPALYLPMGEHVSILRSPTGEMKDLAVSTVLAKAKDLLERSTVLE